MKKKFTALFLALLMLLCVCGCTKEPDNSSSDSVIIESEEIIIDETGNLVTNSNSDIANPNTTNSDTTNSSSTNSNTTTNSNSTISSVTNSGTTNSNTTTNSNSTISSEINSNTTTNSNSTISSVTNSGATNSNTDTNSNSTISSEINSNTTNSSTTNSSVTSSQDTTSSNNSTVTKPVQIDYNTVVEIDICDDIVRAYLDSNDAYNQYYWLSTYNGQRFDHQNIKLNWILDGSSEFTVYFSQNADFSNAITYKANYTQEVKNATLIPGTTYYWKVIGSITSDPLGGGKIKIKDAPVRWIYVDGIRNVRDMGGWKTESGKTVKYEMLYRGAQLNTEKDGAVVNTVSEVGLETFNSLGIKTEFDLRSEQNVHEKANGTKLNYVWVSTKDNAYSAYDGIAGKSQKEMYKKMFNYLSDSSNYPIYAHCQGGADRTGSYAFLLNGLLGVSYDDLVRDFEMTSLAGQKRWRSAGNGTSFGEGDEDVVDGGVTVKWRAMYNYMMEYGKQNGCTTLQQSIEHWFINDIGVPNAQIDSFKSIMLE